MKIPVVLFDRFYAHGSFSRIIVNNYKGAFDAEKLSAKPKSIMTSVIKEDSEFKGLFKQGASKGTMEAYQKLSEIGLFK